jgi:hypothetical protein
LPLDRVHVIGVGVDADGKIRTITGKLVTADSAKEADEWDRIQ